MVIFCSGLLCYFPITDIFWLWYYSLLSFLYFLYIKSLFCFCFLNLLFIFAACICMNIYIETLAFLNKSEFMYPKSKWVCLVGIKYIITAGKYMNI